MEIGERQRQIEQGKREDIAEERREGEETKTLVVRAKQKGLAEIVFPSLTTAVMVHHGL